MKKTEYSINLCAGFGCIGSGAKEIKEAFQECLKKFGLEDDCEIVETGCIGLCSNGPMVVIYPEGVLYQKLKPEDVGEIVEGHLLKGNIVQRLTFKDPSTGRHVPFMNDIEFFKKQRRTALRNCGIINPSRISDYVRRGGYDALARVAKEMSPEDVIAAVGHTGLPETSGERSFVGEKWSALKEKNDGMKYIICNANGCDAGVYINRSILEGDPHSVIEGMAIAAFATGACQGYIYLHPRYGLTTQRLRRALKQAREYKCLGRNILGTDFHFNLEICGDNSKPFSKQLTRLIPDSPFETHLSLSDVACAVHSLEAFADIPTIILKDQRPGEEKISKKGGEGETKVLALAGRVNNAGLVEIPLGISLRSVIYDIGGGLQDNGKFKAVQIGGPFGGFIPEKFLDMPIDDKMFRKLDISIGAGGLTVLDKDMDIVGLTKYLVEFVENEFCKNCPPVLLCKEKIRQIRDILDRMCEGAGDRNDINRLTELCRDVKSVSYCEIGKHAPLPVISAMRHFKKEFKAKIRVKSFRADTTPKPQGVPLDKTPSSQHVYEINRLSSDMFVNLTEEQVKHLIQSGADINMKNSIGQTLLSKSSFSGNAEMVNLLIDLGADVNTSDKEGRTPLFFAAMNGKIDVAKLLIDNGADVHVSNHRCWTSLYIAANKGHVEIVKLLLHHGADVDVKDKKGLTALYYAALFEHGDVVKLLIEHGADVTIRDKSGWSPLDYSQVV